MNRRGLANACCTCANIASL